MLVMTLLLEAIILLSRLLSNSETKKKKNLDQKSELGCHVENEYMKLAWGKTPKKFFTTPRQVIIQGYKAIDMTCTNILILLLKSCEQ